jgi:glucosamine-6-phosphate deaminase
LQNHASTEFVLDYSSASNLTRYVCPWTIKTLNADSYIKFDEYWMKKAVVWLALKVGKSILRLIEADYEDNGLMELLN